MENLDKEADNRNSEMYKDFLQNGIWTGGSVVGFLKKCGFPLSMEGKKQHFVYATDEEIGKAVQRAAVLCLIPNQVGHRKEMNRPEAQRFKGCVAELALQQMYGEKLSEFAYGDVNGQDKATDLVVDEEIYNIKAITRTKKCADIPGHWIANISDIDIERTDHPKSRRYLFAHIFLEMKEEGGRLSRFDEMDQRIIVWLSKLRSGAREKGIVFKREAKSEIMEYVASLKMNNFIACFKEIVAVGSVSRQEVLLGNIGIKIPSGVPRGNGSRASNNSVYEIPYAQMSPPPKRSA